MKLKEFFDNREEFVVGAGLQLPFFYIFKEWTILIMVVCSVFWRLGGAHGGSKLFRRVGVPCVICGATALITGGWLIFLAAPFMVWLSPAYGATSGLFEFYIELVGGDEKKADFLTRTTTYIWYWVSFGIVLIFTR